MNTPGHNIANFLIPILEILTHDGFTINSANIYLFKINNRKARKRCEICSKVTIKHENDVNNVSWERMIYMASLDVEFLFISIPLNEAINNCISDLHNKNLYVRKLSKGDFFKLRQTVTSNFF